MFDPTGEQKGSTSKVTTLTARKSTRAMFLLSSMLLKISFTTTLVIGSPRQLLLIPSTFCTDDQITCFQSVFSCVFRPVSFQLVFLVLGAPVFPFTLSGALSLYIVLLLLRFDVYKKSSVLHN